MGHPGRIVTQRAAQGMNMGDLARYLMVSRQNLSGVLGRMERDGRIEVVTDTRDRRSRLIRITREGWKVWHEQAQPKIHDYYQAALEGFSVSDQIHATHYLPRCSTTWSGSTVAAMPKTPTERQPAPSPGHQADAAGPTSGHRAGRRRALAVPAARPGAGRRTASDWRSSAGPRHRHRRAPCRAP